MCGIVGYVGSRPAVDVLVKGLQRLEYRGYDSAGVGLFVGDELVVRKAEGRLENVVAILEASKARFAAARVGIGHTRWATHGRPTTQNAHPHRAGHVALVANGIIENYQEIRRRIFEKGHRPGSDTDSELLCFLILDRMDHGGLTLQEAVRQSFTEIEGACSIVAVSEKEPGVIVGIRNGSPLAAAIDPQGGAVLASDAQPLVEYSRDVFFLDQGEGVAATSAGLSFFKVDDGARIEKKAERIDWTPEVLDRGGYPHYMLKEIHEQPGALVDTLNSVLDRSDVDHIVLAAHPGKRFLDDATELSVAACGTSFHASMLGRYWMEKWARLPMNVELASELRYRDFVTRPGCVALGMTQSGETADTLAALREMKRRQVPTLALTNVRGSTVTREVDGAFFTAAGPEIGVAATKTFLTQIEVLFLWACYLGDRRRTFADGQRIFDAFLKVPHVLEKYLELGGPLEVAVQKACRAMYSKKGFFFIGRGYSYPIALEGALKLKEVSYIHAEAYAAGELKHGPIAMIDEGLAVVVLAPPDRWREKTISNLEEIRARGSKVVSVGAADDEALIGLSDFFLPMPQGISAKKREANPPEELFPFYLTPAVQLLAYHTAVACGTNVDKPRNLAKSVTVE